MEAGLQQVQRQILDLIGSKPLLDENHTSFKLPEEVAGDTIKVKDSSRQAADLLVAQILTALLGLAVLVLAVRLNPLQFIQRNRPRASEEYPTPTREEAPLPSQEPTSAEVIPSLETEEIASSQPRRNKKLLDVYSVGDESYEVPTTQRRLRRHLSSPLLKSSDSPQNDSPEPPAPLSYTLRPRQEASPFRPPSPASSETSDTNSVHSSGSRRQSYPEPQPKRPPTPQTPVPSTPPRSVTALRTRRSATPVQSHRRDTDLTSFSKSSGAQQMDAFFSKMSSFVSSSSAPNTSSASSSSGHLDSARSTSSAQQYPSLAVRQHKMLADQAFRTISAGLDKEQGGSDIAGALELYKRGLRDLRSALRIEFNSEEERWRRLTMQRCDKI
ncbi:hypothetical protein DFJ73DRAFT_558137 [Zopfochytrium polystomum]|nr:hypothetical protein DFJ73DRAFT_558137 [Zopfochytrium polystomum]